MMLITVVHCWLLMNVFVMGSHTNVKRSENAFVLPDTDFAVDHFEINSAEEKVIEDLGSYDEEVSRDFRLQRRGTRSPSRCIPHQQSCLGHHLPCCSPCDTCYCRFFKAFCYCRSMDLTCKHEYSSN